MFALLGGDAFPDMDALAAPAPVIEHSKPAPKKAAAPTVLPDASAAAAAVNEAKANSVPAAAAAPPPRSTGKMIALELQRLFASTFRLRVAREYSICRICLPPT